MADLFGEAMLGAIFGELLKVVTEAKNKSDKHETELAMLKSTLESIKPIIQEIETLNIALNILEQETARLKEELIKGTELVRKCSEVKCCCFKKVNYADKLIQLNQSIERFIKVNMQKQLPPDPPASTPGLDDSLKELRKELVKDNGMQVIVVTAPGGAGRGGPIWRAGPALAGPAFGKFRENIFFVTVSDVKTIIQRIFQHKKREEVPTFQTNEAAINDLERLLKSFGQKAILLVLDDVWLESLVQKFKFKLPN
ncbi:hypothetical protein LWI28_012542 [Acer negundo]|uniref:RPW8 domain-containing protein n=1 Tax=Acer negundo TaxID=4023 RepID=A0AAD5IJ78_ACENE|nr:hypothetical protein LWI28_012542 [Acer negundo]KAK4840410.1 hypothetical protein QYF36_008164 [Acer negundo]